MTTKEERKIVNCKNETFTHEMGFGVTVRCVVPCLDVHIEDLDFTFNFNFLFFIRFQLYIYKGSVKDFIIIDRE